MYFQKADTSIPTNIRSKATKTKQENPKKKKKQ